MPGFIRTAHDEKRWSKAKSAVSRSKNKDEKSFTDQDWALVNHIYHQMSKAEDIGESIREMLSKTDELTNIDNLDELKTFLEKARRKLSDEPSDEDLESQGYRVFDPGAEESDDADKWLRENDPSQAKQPDYQEYEPEEDDEAHMAEAGADKPADFEPFHDEPKHAGKFRQPTKEELAEMRQYTRPWEQRARDKARLEAEAHKNPVLHHEGRLVEARNLAHKSKQDAYAEFQASPEYQNADPITQMEMDAKFHNDWHSKNPEYLKNAMALHGEAHEKGRKAKDIHSAAKDEKIHHILAGGASADEPMSVEAAMQHAGGAKGEEGTVGTMVQDPAAAFAAGHQDFLKQYAKEYASKQKKPKDVGEMMDYDKESRADIARVLGEHPALKDPTKKAKVDAFFEHYYPLIAINAHKVLNKLGLGHKKNEMDLGLMHEAGMHGLFQAINDYEHDHPSQASFSTHAGNKIRGLMQTALRAQQEDVPQEMKTQAKQFEHQAPIAQAPQPVEQPKVESAPAAKPVSAIIRRHAPEVVDRYKRAQTARQVIAPKIKNEGEK